MDTDLRPEDKIDERQQERFNPTAKSVDTLENDTGAEQANFDREFAGIAANFDDTADPSQENQNIQKLKDKEAIPYKEPAKVDDKKPSKIANFAKKRLPFIALGGVTISGLVITMFMSMLPLKIEMFVRNITEAASRVPAYATEQRTEYIISRIIATRILMMSDVHVDGNLVFCKTGGIACSLFRTYTTDLIEKKFDLAFNRTTRGVEIRTVAHGRTQLGGKGQSWTIEGTRTGPDGERVNRIIKELDNKGMKKYIREAVDKKMHHKTVLSRYVVRKILMRKYGVTTWRAFPKTQAKIADMKTTFRSKMISNTIGKLSPRMGMYLSCMQQTETCTKSLNELSSSQADIDKLQQEADNAPEGKEKDKAKARVEKAKMSNESLKKIAGVDMGEGADKATGNALQKFFSSKIIKAVGGPLAVAGILDLIFSGIEGVDNGGLDQISQDMTTRMYAGLAYGDETGLIPNSDKMKAMVDSSNDFDIRALELATAQLDGAEKSPLMQAENGISGSNTSGKSASARCFDGDKFKQETLPNGQLVCSNQLIIKNYLKNMAGDPGWETIAGIAKAWNNSAGLFFDVLGEITGTLIGAIPGLDKLFNLAGKAMSPLLTWCMNLMFNPPPAGPEAGGDNNYVALSGALWSQLSESAAMGAGEDGSAMGSGGKALTGKEVGYINDHYNTQEADEIKSRPVLASLFDINIKGSLTQQLALTAPTNGTAMLNSLLSMPSSLLKPISVPVSAAVKPSTSNPFNIVQYGYRVNDAALTADPNIYTEESCAVSAKEREDSLKKPSETNRQFPIPVYTKTDPCALEKVAVGAALVSAGNYDDDYSLKDVDGGGDSAAGSSATAGAEVFNVASYNMCQENEHPKLCVSVANKTPIISKNFKEGLTSGQPLDIIGAQEVSQDTQRNVAAASGYSTFPNSVPSAQGRAIFWNPAKFTKATDGRIGDVYSNEGSFVGQNSDKAFPWVELKDKNGRSYFVISVHSPRGVYAGPDARIHNANKVLAWAKSKSSGDNIVIVTGDFNRSGNKEYTGSSDRGNAGRKYVGGVYCVLTGPEGIFQHASDMARGIAEGERCPTADANKIPFDQIYISRGKGITASNWGHIDNRTRSGTDHSPAYVTFSLPGAVAANTVNGSIAWPVDKSNWDRNKAIFLKAHGGAGTFTSPGTQNISLDLGLPQGTQVYAMAGGTVVKKPLGRRSRTCVGNPNNNDNGGLMIESVVNGKKLSIAYAHGDQVTANTQVNAGDPIMKIGLVGNTCAAHVHIDMSYDGKNICPQDVFLALGANQTPDFEALKNRAVSSCGR